MNLSLNQVHSISDALTAAKALAHHSPVSPATSELLRKCQNAEVIFSQVLLQQNESPLSSHGDGLAELGRQERGETEPLRIAERVVLSMACLEAIRVWKLNAANTERIALLTEMAEKLGLDLQ